MDQERSQLPLLAFVTVHRELPHAVADRLNTLGGANIAPPNALGVCIRQLLVFVALGSS
jgi:hypothetical protein